MLSHLFIRKYLFLTLGLFVITACLTFNSGTSEGESNSTSNLSMSLVPTFESVGVYLSFSGDLNEDNQAILEYRMMGTSRWIRGMDMTPDRRDTVTRKSIPNPYNNQWRA